jgi:hypothetical protein
MPDDISDLCEVLAQLPPEQRRWIVPELIEMAKWFSEAEARIDRAQRKAHAKNRRTNVRTKRSDQIPLLKAAALALAERQSEATVISNIPTTEVKLDTLNFCLTSFGPRIILEVWAEAHGGNKVLNITWGPEGDIEVVGFRRGDWETALLGAARKHLN